MVSTQGSDSVSRPLEIRKQPPEYRAPTNSGLRLKMATFNLGLEFRYSNPKILIK